MQPQQLPQATFHPGILPSHTPLKKRPKPCKLKKSLHGIRPNWFVAPFSAVQHMKFNTFFSLLGLNTFNIERRSEEDGAAYKELVYQNARLRWSAACLLKRWLMRRSRRMNEEDIVTLEPPRQRIDIYDWAARRVYSYEASTIARDIRECLLQRDYMFPSPILPRNLLTNESLSHMQVSSVFHQLRQTRKGLHWSFSAFEEGAYDLSRFVTRFAQPLRHEVLRTLALQPTHADTIDIVEDFISDQHSYHGVPFPRIIYQWALKHAHDAPRICEWRRLAFRHHEIEIEIADESERSAKQEKELDDPVEKLCKRPIELIILRNAWKRKQLASGVATQI